MKDKISEFLEVLLLVLVALLCIVWLSSCKTVQPVVIEKVKHDTTLIYEKADTVVIMQNVLVPVPLEKDKAICNVGDTARAKTSVAEAKAWNDRLGLLHLQIKNHGQIKHPIPETTISSSRDEYHAKSDTVQVPYPVEVVKTENSKFARFAIWWFIGTVIWIILKIVMIVYRFKI